MTDIMREGFVDVNARCTESEYTYYKTGYAVGYKAAQADARAFKTRLLEALYPAGIKHPQQTEDDWIIDAVKQRGDARALVGELVGAMSLYMADGDDGDIEIAIAKALTKAQAFMEGK